MVEIWKEKEEDLQKFQNLCKFRVIQIMRAKKAYEESPEGKEYEREIRQLNEQIKQDKINEEKRKKEEEEKAKKKPFLTKSYTISKKSSKKYNPYNDIMINNPPPLPSTKMDNYGITNPFADMLNNPYNLPPPSINKSALVKKFSKKRVIYSKNDKEAQEIDNMYDNYDPGEYQQSPPENNNNSNFYNIYDRPYIPINKNNLEDVMKQLLQGYEYPGSKEINIGEIPVLFRSTDFYKLRLHIKSILIPKIISQLKKNNAEEAYQNSKMLMYYLSIMNPQ